MNEDRQAVSASLLRHLGDAELEIAAWDRNGLRIVVTKEIGNERGVLEFTGVSHVSLPPVLTIAGLRIGTVDDLPTDFFALHRPSDQQLDASERVFLIEGSWGERCLVIAESIEYRIVE